MAPSLLCLKINSRKSLRGADKHAHKYMKDMYQTCTAQQNHTQVVILTWERRISLVLSEVRIIDSEQFCFSRG